MSRIGISYQAVENAALQLQGLGKNPTVDRVREILGTGSKSTIARHLKVWHQDTKHSDPNALPQELMSLVGGIWAQLQEKASQRVADAQFECDQKIENTLQEKLQCEKELKASQLTILNLETTLEKQTAEIQKLHREFLIVQEEKMKFFHYANGLEKYIAEQKSENEKLYQLFNNVQKNLEHYQSAMQRLQHEQSLAMDNQKSKYERMLSDLQHQLTVESTEKNTLRVQLEQLSIQFESHTQFTANLEMLLKEKEINEALFKERYENLNKQYEADCRKLDNTLQALHHSQEKNVVDSTRIHILTQDLRESAEKVTLLQQQYTLLSQEKANLEGRLELIGSHLVYSQTT